VANGKPGALVEKENSIYSFYTPVGDNAPINNGAGEKITLAIDYIPTSFSVFIHKTQYFKKVSTSTGVAVDLHLSIWNALTKALLASSVVHVNARSTTGPEDGEEAIFLIEGAPSIPAGTPVLYGIYLPTAIEDDVKGNLLYYQSGTDPFSDGRFWIADGAADLFIAEFDEWMESTATFDLKFKLVGIEQ